MRLVRPALLVLVSLTLFSFSVAAQQPPRDPQAVVVLQRALVAMGGAVPTDSVATGTITIGAGPTSENGTVRILTRGLDQTAEQINTPLGRRAVIHSRGRAAEAQGDSSRRLQLELVVTSQTVSFPLIPIARALNNPNVGLEYVGPETLEGVSVHHIRIWETFPGQPRLQHLAEFSAKDVWIHAASGLPRKVSYHRREARGATPRIPMDVFFTDYRTESGVQYPFLIQKSVNGTPFITIRIQNVALNTGLSDADFPVR